MRCTLETGEAACPHACTFTDTCFNTITIITIKNGPKKGCHLGILGILVEKQLSREIAFHSSFIENCVLGK